MCLLKVQNMNLHRHKERERDFSFMFSALDAGHPDFYDINYLTLQILKEAEIPVHCTDKAVKYSCKKMQGMEWSFSPFVRISLAASFKKSFQHP